MSSDLQHFIARRLDLLVSSAVGSITVYGDGKSAVDVIRTSALGFIRWTACLKAESLIECRFQRLY